MYARLAAKMKIIFVSIIFILHLLNLKPLANARCQIFSRYIPFSGSRVYFDRFGSRNLQLRGGDGTSTEASSMNLRTQQNVTDGAPVASAFTQVAKMTTEQLYDERTRIENSIDSVLAQLEALGMPQPPPGAFVHQPLIDAEGFPRSDIDIPTVLSLRGRLVSLRAQRREVELRLEQAMEAYFATDQPDADSDPAAADGSTDAAAPLRIRGGRGTSGRLDAPMDDSDGPEAHDHPSPPPPLFPG